MHTLYTPLTLNQQNWQTYQGSLATYPIRLSDFSRLESSIRAKGISLKYVEKGHERYKLGNKLYHLYDNQFVINNQFIDCEVFINEKENSKGICIDIDAQYFADILQSLFTPNEIDDLHQNTRFFLSEELFCQGIYADASFQALLKKVETVGEMFFLEDFLKEVSYHLILSQQKLIREYNNIDAIKASTKKELYARLLQSRNIMLEEHEHQYGMKEIAQMICLSEFRFYHLFKSTFGITPHQFQTQVLLEKSLKLYEEKRYSWTEIAEKVGYADIQTFGKVFKKYYGKSPKAFMQQIPSFS